MMIWRATPHRPARVGLVCCVLFLLIAPTFCLADDAKAPKKVVSIEGITEYRLDNGLKVLLFPDSSKPTVTVNVTYLVGSRHEGYGETGMAHLLEHMLFKGTEKRGGIMGELTSHGAQLTLASVRASGVMPLSLR